MEARKVVALVVAVMFLCFITVAPTGIAHAEEYGEYGSDDGGIMDVDPGFEAENPTPIYEEYGGEYDECDPDPPIDYYGPGFDDLDDNPDNNSWIPDDYEPELVPEPVDVPPDPGDTGIFNELIPDPEWEAAEEEGLYQEVLEAEAEVAEAAALEPVEEEEDRWWED
ncbi:MAG: hypothetical protein HQ579_03680 [Candidatus Omnitrophica bacterium]|nr:hypothetical protein [Candidatus Omnitrophota bacterium]